MPETFTIRAIYTLVCLSLVYAGGPRCRLTGAFLEWMFTDRQPEPAACHETTPSSRSESETAQLSVWTDTAECRCEYDNYVYSSQPQPRRTGDGEITTAPRASRKVVTLYEFHYRHPPSPDVDTPPPKPAAIHRNT